MLAPRTSNAFVCFRCEAQLAQRRVVAAPRLLQRPNFSTSARRHGGLEDLEAESAPPPSSNPPSSKFRIKKEVQPLDRIRKRKGRVLRETSAKLGGLKRLGDDAEILVLREVANPTPQEPATQSEIVEPAVVRQVPDLLASLQQEDVALTTEEVFERLKSLRPKIHADAEEPHYIAKAQFVKLLSDLTRGFTLRQLSQFYSVTKNVKPEMIVKRVLKDLKASHATAETEAEKRIISRTEWQPGTTPVSRRLLGIDLAAKPKHKLAGKQALVDRILRDVWKLVPLEEVEGLGEIELSMKPWELTLINTGDPGSILDQVRMVRRVQIDIFWQHNVLRITADKSTAEYAAQDIEKALQNTDTRKIQMKPWARLLEGKSMSKDASSPMFSTKDLEAVSSLTRATVKPMDNMNALMIRGIDKTATGELIRNLLNLLPLRKAASYTVDTRELESAKGSHYLTPVLYDENCLEHKNRNSKLGRWSRSIRRISDSQTDGQKFQQEDVVTYNVQDLNSRKQWIQQLEPTLLKYSGSPGNASGGSDIKTEPWSSKYTSKLSAKFGQALFPLSEIAHNQSGSHSFLPTFPGLSSMVSAIGNQGDLSTKAPALVYNFIADPQDKHRADNDGSFPSLQVEIHTDAQGGNPIIHEIRLNYERHVHDVLLPGNATDMRFSSHNHLILAKLDDPEVQAWATKVCANIESGDRLMSPSFRITIPRWAIPGRITDTETLPPVTFRCTNIQFQQAITGSFQGAPLTYTAVQSGKLGARTGILELHHEQANKDSQDLTLTTFIKTCFNMADTITSAAGQNKPLTKKLRPRSENSERRIKRMAEKQKAGFPTQAQAPLQGDVLESSVYQYLTNETSTESHPTTPVENDLVSPSVDSGSENPSVSHSTAEK